MPDKQWILDVISTLNPNHAIFQKGYVPEKTEEAETRTVYVRNDDGLYDGLPELYKAKDLNKPVRAATNTEEMLMHAIAREKNLEEKRKKRLAALEEKLEEQRSGGRTIRKTMYFKSEEEFEQFREFHEQKKRQNRGPPGSQ